MWDEANVPASEEWAKVPRGIKELVDEHIRRIEVDERENSSETFAECIRIARGVLRQSVPEQVRMEAEAQHIAGQVRAAINNLIVEKFNH